MADEAKVRIRGVPVQAADLPELRRQIALLESYTSSGATFDPTPVEDAFTFFELAAKAGHPTRPSGYKQVLEEIDSAFDDAASSN